MKPRVISSVVLKKDNKILLVKEMLENNEDCWIFPGGGVDFGETIEDAAVREVKEELGIDVEIKKFLFFKEAIYPKYNYHTVIFFFLAEPINNEIKTIEQILDVGYFSNDEIKKLNLVTSAKWVMEELNKKNII